MPRTLLTREGYEKLRRELVELKSKKRPEIADAIEKARQLGDLKENSEFETARDAMKKLLERINILEVALGSAQIIDKENVNIEGVYFGTKVILEEVDTGKKLEYYIVGGLEANLNEGKISIDSPVARGLLGHKKGEIVTIKIPKGIIKYKILDITK